jgi:protein phosphatase 2C family protein 2/3
MYRTLHVIFVYRPDFSSLVVLGDKLLLDGKLVEVEDTGSGSVNHTFDGIENAEYLLVEASNNQTGLHLRTTTERVDAFRCIRTPLKLRPNDVIRVGLLKFEVYRYNSASVSVQGIRPSMEDEDFCRDGLFLTESRMVSMFNVYDGHGGSDASKFLRTRFHKVFQESFISDPGKRISAALLETFERCDSELLSLVRDKGLSTGVGAVVNSVVIDTDGNFYCANLGDCRALIGIDGGGVVELSRDLKPLVPEETERIKRCGGFVSSGNRVNGRLAVSRAIGDFEYKANLAESGKGRETMVSAVPEIRCYRSQGIERFLVIGCDGLYDVMRSEDVVGFINDRISSFVARNQEPDPSQICVDLVTECVIKRGTSDNVTIILVLLSPSLRN